MLNFNLDAEDMAELEEEIRATCKITLRPGFLFLSPIPTSLPDEVKLALLTSKANSK